VVCVTVRLATDPVTGISATGGSATFTRRVTQQSTSASRIYFYTASNVGSGITSITVALSAAIVMSWAQEYSGVDNTTPMDVTATTQQLAAVSPITSASIVPATIGSVVLAGVSGQGRANTVSPFKYTTAGPTAVGGTQAGAGWAAEHDLWNQGAVGSSLGIVVASNEVNNSGTYQCNWTPGAAIQSAQATIVLRPGSTGPATSLVPPVRRPNYGSLIQL
jgi:hypothetical protein